MSAQEQLDLWVNGTSVHNNDAGIIGGECCPDFSCCNPAMKWSDQKRLEFAAADESTRHKMLMGSIVALVDYHEYRKVRIIG